MKLRLSSQNILKLILNISLFKSTFLSQFYVESLDTNAAGPVPRVVNGILAKLGEVPYQIAFKSLYSRLHNEYMTFCGGVIISETKLLSAAHCFAVKKTAFCSESVVVKGRFLARKYAVAGNLLNKDIHYHKDGSSQGQWRRLKEVIYPAKFVFPRYDIAVVMIATPLFFDDNVAPIPYATRFKDYLGECLASGYGRTSPSFSKIKENADNLMLANISIVQAKTCNKKHRRNMKHFICTSDIIADVSKGDSGGPLVCFKTEDPSERDKGILVGIVSGNKLGAGSFFTRVSSYYKYVQRNRAERTSLSNCFRVYSMLVIYGFYLF